MITAQQETTNRSGEEFKKEWREKRHDFHVTKENAKKACSKSEFGPHPCMRHSKPVGASLAETDKHNNHIYAFITLYLRITLTNEFIQTTQQN